MEGGKCFGRKLPLDIAISNLFKYSSGNLLTPIKISFKSKYTFLSLHFLNIPEEPSRPCKNLYPYADNAYPAKPVPHAKSIIYESFGSCSSVTNLETISGSAKPTQSLRTNSYLSAYSL